VFNRSDIVFREKELGRQVGEMLASLALIWGFNFNADQTQLLISLGINMGITQLNLIFKRMGKVDASLVGALGILWAFNLSLSYRSLLEKNFVLGVNDKNTPIEALTHVIARATKKDGVIILLARRLRATSIEAVFTHLDTHEQEFDESGVSELKLDDIINPWLNGTITEVDLFCGYKIPVTMLLNRLITICFANYTNEPIVEKLITGMCYWIKNFKEDFCKEDKSLLEDFIDKLNSFKPAWAEKLSKIVITLIIFENQSPDKNEASNGINLEATFVKSYSDGVISKRSAPTSAVRSPLREPRSEKVQDKKEKEKDKDGKEKEKKR